MDNSLIPDLFAVTACCTLIVFLWSAVLESAKKRLLAEDHNTARFLLILISLPLAGVALHYGGDVWDQLFGVSGPF
jgi:hypothetical protein